jgi:hypothetical protein
MPPIWGIVWWDSSMKQTKSSREVVDQAVRPLAGLAVVEDPRVVLDPRAEADLAQHLHVVLGALAQAVGLQQLALRLELGAALVELGADRRDRALDLALGGRCSASPARSRRARGRRRSPRRSAGRSPRALDLVAEQHRSR